MEHSFGIPDSHRGNNTKTFRISKYFPLEQFHTIRNENQNVYFAMIAVSRNNKTGCGLI